ncbi:MAG: hypothetical protein ACRD0Q_10580 [Acidimicrobiales bacterium]
MGRASSSKKVARAARTGGGRTRKGTSSLGWPSAMAVVVIIGIALVVVSRGDRSAADETPPRANVDHWHTAIGFDICGTFAPSPSSDTDPLGIHTHGDGVIHTHPFVGRAAGRRATVSHYFDNVGAKVTTSQIDLAGQPVKKNGAKCDGRAAKVRTWVWNTRDPEDKGNLYTGDPGDIRLGNNQLITVAFLPDGVDIPRPPSEAELDQLTDIGTTPAPTPEGSVPPADGSVPPADGSVPPAATTPSSPPPSAP